MYSICILTFIVGFVAGCIYTELTWDEEKELRKIAFKRSKKSIKF